MVRTAGVGVWACVYSAQRLASYHARARRQRTGSTVAVWVRGYCVQCSQRAAWVPLEVAYYEGQSVPARGAGKWRRARSSKVSWVEAEAITEFFAISVSLAGGGVL